MKEQNNNATHSSANERNSIADDDLTVEQAVIINTDKNVHINAVAGSGKTTTVIEYAAARPPKAKILYLAFNKSVKLEAARKLIRDKLIKSMNDLDDLEEYIEKTEDVQLAMILEVVREYGNEISGIIKSLKNLHTGDEDRSKAEMILSTVHRARGMEYDVVHLVNDFITEPKLEKPKSAKEEGLFDIPKLNEEINLLYVAITRTKNKLYIPETLWT